MPGTEFSARRHAIPILYTKGTHYEVGYDVGRTFGALIHSFVDSFKTLNKEYIPAYETPEGRKAFENTLNTVKINFPQYVRELEGMADGSKVPFYKLFLLNMDRIITYAAGMEYDQEAVGCSDICINEPGQEIIGHTEDALSETLNHFYFVSAHIKCDKPQGRWGVAEENFTSLCYAGSLPGYTMSYNHHGLVYTINTLSAKHLVPGKSPRSFITRALLTAKNFVEAQQILRDPGCGAADGCSINMTFLQQEGNRMFHNVEMGPAGESKNSQLSVLTASPGEQLLHLNSYLRLPIPELHGGMFESSEARMQTLKCCPRPQTKEDVIQMLGDQSGTKYRVFQEFGPEDVVKTIAVGIFDCVERTWSIYADNPRKHDPLVVLPIRINSTNKEN